MPANKHVLYPYDPQKSSLTFAMPPDEEKAMVSIPRNALYIIVAMFLLLLLLVIIIPLVLHFGHRCEWTAQNGTNSSGNHGVAVRLPTNILPIRYWLSLQVYLPSRDTPIDPSKEFFFDGNVTILLKCDKETSNVTLHAHKINITKDSFRFVHMRTDSIEGSPLNLRTDSKEAIVIDTQHQQITFMLNESLKVQRRYKLQLSYRGELTDDLAGFYRSSYSENGEKKWLGVTQFQPTAARRALPCFDEPQMKAEFWINITHPRQMRALSNAMEDPATELLPGNWRKTTFHKSPKMSTYLLAFVVCEFDHKFGTTLRGTKFRIWARPELVQQTTFAAQIGPKILDFFEQYFDIPFPLEKQDMVAIPDFDAGAMENWGLVTYRDVFLLYSPLSSSARSRQQVAEVIAHELAHQWFGNLVTMEWWDDLWLNEGFATLMQYIGTDNALPGTFHMADQFVTNSAHLAMEPDQLPSTHALHVPVSDPLEISQIFDRITYDKAASVIRMLQFVLGDKVFQQGLNNYLKAYQYKNAMRNDLWQFYTEALKAGTGLTDWNGQPLNVESFMECWIELPGYPMVEVARNYAQMTMSVSQERFLVGNSSGVSSSSKPESCSEGWIIPLWYQYGSSPVPQFSWLRPGPPTTFPLPQGGIGGIDQWILINPLMRGFYRPLYDDRNWNLLKEQLDRQHTVIDSTSRAQVLNDAFTFSRSGKLSYNIALGLSQYLKKEYHFVPWEAVSTEFEFLYAVLSEDPILGKFKSYFLSLVEPVYHKMGFEDAAQVADNMLDHKLRAMSWRYACHLQLKHCTDTAKQLFARLKIDCSYQPSSTSCNQISPNLRDAVYCTGVAEGTHSDWEFLWKKFKMEVVATEKWALLGGITCSRNTTTLNTLMDIVTEAKLIRLADAGVALSKIAKNSLATPHQHIVWQHMKSHWNVLMEKFGKTSALTMMVRYVTAYFTTREELKDLEDFVVAHKDNLGSVKKAFAAQIEATNGKITWLEKYGEIVTQWLSQH